MPRGFDGVGILYSRVHTLCAWLPSRFASQTSRVCIVAHLTDNNNEVSVPDNNKAELTEVVVGIGADENS